MDDKSKRFFPELYAISYQNENLLRFFYFHRLSNESTSGRNEPKLTFPGRSLSRSPRFRGFLLCSVLYFCSAQISLYSGFWLRAFFGNSAEASKETSKRGRDEKKKRVRDRNKRRAMLMVILCVCVSEEGERGNGKVTKRAGMRLLLFLTVKYTDGN